MKYLRVLFFFVCLTSLGQQSEEFLLYSSNLKPSDSTIHKKEYGNGNLKTKGEYYIYENGDYYYKTPIGQWIDYYKSGEAATITEYDKFGNVLSWRLFEKDGTKTWETNTLRITTSAKNIDQFLRGGKYINIEAYEKRYKYSYKSCKWFLVSEGKTVNNSRIGKWMIYNFDGTIKKEKIH